jgi:pimeloyl-ACP methyl ester carboxylesterase
MTPAPAAAVTTGELAVPGASLYYEVRGSGPLVLLAAAPMDAASFAPLADLLAGDRTVLTTDPRGIGRSPVEDPDADSTPGERADDLARLLAHVGAGPADVLGSSGGAVSVLALAQSRPELLRTVVAHEPPLDELLDDRDRLRAETEAMIARYRDGDRVGAWRQFLATADIHLPEEVFAEMFGRTPEPQALADERFQFLHMLRGTTRWEPDVARLTEVAAAGVRVVPAVGERSSGELCDRTTRALAAALGTEPVLFPGDHVGFAGDPPAFAARLRQVLAGA